jgi:hypothetical protein
MSMYVFSSARSLEQLPSEISPCPEIAAPANTQRHQPSRAQQNTWGLEASERVDGRTARFLNNDKGGRVVLRGNESADGRR